MICKRNRSYQLLGCPQLTSQNSHEIVADGPISIWHYTDDDFNTNDQYAFQILRELVPMFFVTYNHQTSIITQSTIPIYIPSDLNVIVNVISENSSGMKSIIFVFIHHFQDSKLLAKILCSLFYTPRFGKLARHVKPRKRKMAHPCELSLFMRFLQCKQRKKRILTRGCLCVRLSRFFISRPTKV
ncbi:unnamed protein product [Gongylonema pulchrum]|uniref:Uncharacterized protein n=1 Tax=Gongylonema pulchrum TaxID=637853 RepID=A0A183DM10_9BILA|nr:unnamed protein product [Gongylonema pulchrum]